MDVDDYLDDDFILDDALLESLDACEAKFTAQSTFKRPLSQTAQCESTPANFHTANPPAKRAKLHADENADGLPTSSSPPEIIVTKDGQYQLSTSSIQQSSDIYSDLAASAQRRPANDLDKNAQKKGSNHYRFSTGPDGLHGQTSLDMDHEYNLGQPFTEKLNNMKLEMEQLKSQLRIAEEAKIAKVGEIANLRRNLEERNVLHATEISKLKMEKATLEQQREQAQSELQEEIIRAKHRLAFKQNELESSNRKTAISYTSRALAIQSITGHKSPTKERDPLAWPKAGSHSPAFGPKPSPKREKSSRAPVQATFPGFHNAFQKTKPLISSNINVKGGKQKVLSNETPPLPSGSPEHLCGGDNIMGVETTNSAEAGHDSSDSPIEVDFDYDKWSSDTIRRILLSQQTYEGSQLAILSLLSISIEVASSEDRELFIRSANELTQVLFSHTVAVDEAATCDAVARCLATIGVLLTRFNKIGNLQDLLHLLTRLTSSSALFRERLLTVPSPPSNSSSGTLLSSLIDNIFVSMQHSECVDIVFHGQVSLASCLLSLLETLTWTASGASIGRLANIVRMPIFIKLCINNTKPKWFIIRCLNLLVLLGSHQELVGPALLSTLLEGSDTSTQSQLFVICEMLAKPMPCITEEEVSLRHSILNLLAALSLLPLGSNLKDKDYVISALIMSLYYFSASIWEEDEQVMSSGTLATSIAKAVCHGTILCHLLSMPDAGNSPASNRSILTKVLFEESGTLRATPPAALGHMFVVAVGRLSYGFAPQWLSMDTRQVLDSISEIAQDLLELVIEGPEEDMIWSAYNDGDDVEETAEAAGNIKV